MEKILKQIILLLVVVTASATGLNAQPTSALLSGKVLDEKNIPIQGVAVQVTYVPWNKTKDSQTDKRGFFCVGNLPPGGPYTIKFSRNGYELQTREVLSLELGNNNNLSLHMRLDDKVALGNTVNSGAIALSGEDKGIKRSEL